MPYFLHFSVSISPSDDSQFQSLPAPSDFNIYFTYIKILYVLYVYTYIWYGHISIPLLLPQAAAVYCKEFSTQARKSVAELKNPYCVSRNTPLVMGTSTSAPTTGCKHRGLNLKRFWLRLCAHVLRYFECMRIFLLEPPSWSYFGNNFTSNWIRTKTQRVKEQRKSC